MAAKTLDTKLVELANRTPLIGSIWRAYRRHRAIASSRFVNIYHCCTQKTASQWFRGIFADQIFADHTGLSPHPYIDLGLNQARIERSFPPRTIVVHLYIDFPTFQALPKAEPWKAFYILRDPRDIVVSWYFSAKYSHAAIDPIPTMRRALVQLDEREGMKYIIDQLEGFGSFEAQRSWLAATGRDEIRLFRYERLAADNDAFLAELLDFLEIEMPSAQRAALGRRHSFARLSGGRRQGEEHVASHYRKGVAGDWRNYFDREIERHFEQRTGDLLAVLGY
jgi:hypothetical protein